MLRICELHGEELQSTAVEVAGNSPDYTSGYINDAARMFPNAAVVPLHDGGNHPGRIAESWYCEACRRAEAAWRDRYGGREAGTDRHLTRKTTPDEYGDSWGANTLTGRARGKWMALRAEAEALLAEGGELWEWESSGFRHFAGVCGLAVVRAGEVIKSWQIGRS